MELKRTEEAVAKFNAALAADEAKQEQVADILAAIEQKKTAASTGAQEISLSELAKSHAGMHGVTVQVEGRVRELLGNDTVLLGSGSNAIVAKAPKPLEGIRVDTYVAVTGVVQDEFLYFNSWGWPFFLGFVQEAKIQKAGDIDLDLGYSPEPELPFEGGLGGF